MIVGVPASSDDHLVRESATPANIAPHGRLIDPGHNGATTYA